MSADTATPADAGKLGPMLGRAFDADPMFRFILPSDGSRVRRLSTFFTGVTRHVFTPIGASVRLPNHGGAALWLPPGVAQTRLAPSILSMPSIVFGLGGGIARALPLFMEMERSHPPEPHFYLAVLGIDPPLQGKGLSKSLMMPTLARADEERKLSYLETAKETNVAYYRRFGFEVSRTIQIEGAPPLWCMTRAPSS